MLFRKGSIVFFALLVLPHADCGQYLSICTVTGRLLCHGEPLQNVSIQLYEDDFPDPDDLLRKTRTNANGSFDVTGVERELDGIEPYIEIKNVRCAENCDEKWSMQVWFDSVWETLRQDIGEIEMANVCENVNAEEQLTVPQLITTSKEKEDYETQYSQFMDLRYSVQVREEAQKFGHVVGIRGQITCAGKPLRDLQLKVRASIYYNRPLIVNKTLTTTHMDENGHFVAVGYGRFASNELSLNLYNVTCSTKCTGRREFAFLMKIEEKVSTHTLATIDLAKACQNAELDRTRRQVKYYHVNGRLTCSGNPLGGAHVALCEEDAFFERSTTDKRFISTDTVDTGHFGLHTTELRVNEAVYLNISGVTCGTNCKRNWHVKVLFDDSLDLSVYDLGVMDMNRICSTHESGKTIKYEELLPA